MRVPLGRGSKSADAILVDSRGRARLAGTGAKGLKSYGLAGLCALAAIAPGTGPGEALIGSGRAAIQSAVDFIRARSPGQRSRADLVKTKVRAAPAARPVMRAAPRVRRPASSPAVMLLTPPAAIPVMFDSPPLVPEFQPVIAVSVPVVDDARAVPCCFGGFNPPFTTSGGVIIGGGGRPPVPPPSIPEPSTWAMMILGFAFLGTAWRRRRELLRMVRELPRLFHERLLLLAYVRSS
jgi:hypothetical protein